MIYDVRVALDHSSVLFDVFFFQTFLPLMLMARGERVTIDPYTVDRKEVKRAEFSVREHCTELRT